MGANIRAEGARKRAIEAAREADRAEAEAWSIRMEAFGGPAQPSPTIAQCLNGGYGWMEIECNRCKTRASIPLDAIRRPRTLSGPQAGLTAPITGFVAISPAEINLKHQLSLIATVGRAFGNF